MSFTNRSNLSSRRWRALSIVGLLAAGTSCSSGPADHKLDEDNVWVGWRGSNAGPPEPQSMRRLSLIYQLFVSSATCKDAVLPD